MSIALSTLRNVQSRAKTGLLAAMFVLGGCSDMPEVQMPDWNLGGKKDSDKEAAPTATETPTSGNKTPQSSPPAQMPPQTSKAPLTTVIVSKGAVSSPYEPKELTLAFAVTGGPVSVTINDFRFFCKREYEKSFSACPEAYQYNFKDLKSGTTYTLTVQAVSISTGAVAQADSITFQAK